MGQKKLQPLGGDRGGWSYFFLRPRINQNAGPVYGSVTCDGGRCRLRGAPSGTVRCPAYPSFPAGQGNPPLNGFAGMSAVSAVWIIG